MTHIFYSTWEKPVCCVSKTSSDSGVNQTKLESAWKWGCYPLVPEVFFVRRFATRLRGFAPDEKKKTSGTRVPSLRHLCQVRDPDVLFRKIAPMASYSVLCKMGYGRHFVAMVTQILRKCILSETFIFLQHTSVVWFSVGLISLIMPFYLLVN